MRRYKMPIVLAIILTIAAAAFWLFSTSRAATETPDYKVIRTEDKFEIRDYPALTIATTPMDVCSAMRSAWARPSRRF